MRRGRIIIFVVLILIVGLGIAFVVFQQLLSGSLNSTPQPVVVKVVVAGQNIPQGTEITSDYLTTVDWPQEQVLSVMFTQDQMDQVVGQIARYPLDQGVVITRPMIAESAAEVAVEGPQWASIIPPGMTAIAIPTTRLESAAFGVADGAHVNLTACMLFKDVDPSFQTNLPNNVGLLVGPSNAKPDDMVGVSLGLFSFGENSTPVQGRTEVEPSFQQGLYVMPSEAQRPRLTCQMILQDVVVLRMGSFPTSATGAVSAPAAQATDQQGTAAPTTSDILPTNEVPDIVTLIVSPQDSIALTYMIYNGAKLSMTLRNSTDQSRMATESATLQYLLSQYNIPIPAKLPYATEPRIDELTAPFLPNDVVVVTPEP
jgi:Flp pilus assembly protein CpaB